MERKYTVIDNQTGEFLEISDKAQIKNNFKVTKKLVDKMLSEAKTIEDVDMDMLYTWLKVTKAFNKYNQVKLLGHYISMDFIKLSRENTVLYSYASRLLEITHTFTNIIMKNKQSWITTWTELYEELGIKSPNTQMSFKKFCIKFDIIRVDKTLRTKDSNKFTTRLIVNPFLIRKASHIGQVSLARYSDLAKGSINTDSYALKYLELTGII